MELFFGDESKANELHHTVSDLCRHEVRLAIEKCFNEFSSSDQIVYFNTMELDLGTIEYTELHSQLPIKILEAIKKALSDIFLNSDSNDVQVKSRAGSGLEAITYFLQRGFLPWNARQQDVSVLIQDCLHERSDDFASFLREAGTSWNVRMRLTERFTNPVLQNIIKILEPQYGLIIIEYHNHLVVLNTRESLVKAPQDVVEKTLWLFIFNHLLLERGSVFNTKSFTKSLLRQFSCHFNIEFYDLIALITNGLRKWEGGVPPSFFNLLEEISEEIELPARRHQQAEEKGRLPIVSIELSLFLKQFETNEAYSQGTAAAKMSTSSLLKQALKYEPEQIVAALKRINNKSDVIRRIISIAGMEVPGKIVQVIEPGESDSIIDYHKHIIALHTIDPIANVPQRELAQDLWAFMIINMLDNHGSYFNHKSFLKVLIADTAAHYNLQAQELLGKICLSAKALPSRVSRVNNFFRIIKEIHQESFPMTSASDVSASGQEQKQQLSKAEKLLLTWKAGKNDPKENHERILINLLRSEPVRTVTLLKKYMRQRTVQFRLSTLTEPAFTELISRLFTSHLRPLMRQLMFFLDEMTPEFVHDFGNKENYRQAIRIALCETAVMVNKSGGMSDHDFLRLVIKKVTARGKALKSEKILDRISKYRAHYRIPLLRALIKGEYKDVTPVRIDNLTEGLVRRIISSISNIHSAPVYDGFQSVNEALQFICIQYGDVVMKTIRTYSSKQLHTFIGNLDEEGVDMIMELEAKDQAVWQFSLLREWSHKLFGSFKCKEILFELKRVMLAAHLCDLSPLDGKFLSHIMTLFEKYKVSESFVTKLGQWSLPVYGDAAGAIKKIERRVLDSQISLGGVKDRPEKMRILKDVIKDAHRNFVAKKHSKQENVSEEPIYILNAGLVLVHPYLTFLFEQCNLLSDGKFKTTDMAMRAVAMLHYAVSGKEVYKEEDFVLNKLLCGINIEMVSKKIRLRKSEKQMVDSMLMALASHWEVIKNSNEDDVRGNWLVREGKIRETDAHWELTVKRRAYDLLLDSLPFTLSPVKYPWMEKMIIIQWL